MTTLTRVRPARLDAQARTTVLTFAVGAGIPVGGHLLLPAVIGTGGGLLWFGAAVFAVLGTWVARTGAVTPRSAPVLVAGALLGGNALVACGLDPEYRTAAAAWNLMIPLFLSASLSRRALVVSAVAAIAFGTGAVAVIPGETVVVAVRSVTVAVLVTLPLVYLLGLRDELERALAAARDMARTDTLTGLLNRRGLQDSFETVLRSAPSGDVLAVVSFDLDHFKRINDTYGHAAGDAVLAAAGRSMADGTRARDLVVRLGGEELCVVAAVPSTNHALALAERLRAGIARAGATWSVTASAGVAVVADPAAALVAEPADVLLARLLEDADQRLYRAKTSGRDRVVGPDDDAGPTPDRRRAARAPGRVPDPRWGSGVTAR